MHERWRLKLSQIIPKLLAIGLSLLVISTYITASVQAQTPIESGTINYQDGTKVSADGNCQSGTLTCPDSGPPCFCKPTGNTDSIECHVVTGTTASFKGNKIVMQGGVWAEIAKAASKMAVDDSAIFDPVAGSVTFTKDDRLPNYYSSSILTGNLFPSSGSTNQIGLVVDLEYESSESIVKDVVFANKDSICGNNYINGSIDMTSYDTGDTSACGSGLDSLLAGLKTTGAASTIFPSCGSNNDTLAGLLNEMLTPAGGKKMHMAANENSFLGQVFEAGECENGVREQKIAKIKDFCTTNCVNSNDFIMGLQNSGCADCNNAKLINTLTDNCDKPLTEVLAESAAGDDCSVINGRYSDDASNVNYTAKYSAGDDEQDINQRAPDAIVKMCEDTYPSDAKKRLDCKVNGNKCVSKALAEPTGSGDICGAFDTSLKSSKWILCPIVTTSVAAADKSISLLDKLLSITPNVLNSRVETVWKEVRKAAFALISIGFLVLVISYMTGSGLSNYQVKVMLPRLLTSIFLVTISFYLSRLIIEIADILGDNFQGMFANINDSIAGPRIKLATIVQGGLLAVGVATGAILLASTAFLLAVVPAVFVGFVFGIFLLAFRHTALILLTILSPLAIAAMALPNAENIFSKWLKAFVACVSIYPLTTLIIGLSNLTSKVLSNTTSNPIIHLIALALPALAILAVPKIVMEMIKGAPVAGAQLSQAFSRATGGAYKAGQNTPAYDAIKNEQKFKNQQFLYGKTLTGPLAPLSRKVGKGLQTLNRNQAFRYASGGAVTSGFNRSTALETKQQADIAKEIQDSPMLINAIHTGSSAGLMTDDRAKYDLIMAQYGPTTHIHQLAAAQAAVVNGVTNVEVFQEFYTAATADLQRQNRQTKDIEKMMNDAIQTNFINALRNGQIESAAALQAIKSHRLYTPPANVTEIGKDVLEGSQSYSAANKPAVTVDLGQMISRQILIDYDSNTHLLNLDDAEAKVIDQLTADINTGSGAAHLTTAERTSVINQATTDIQSRFATLKSRVRLEQPNDQSMISLLMASTIAVSDTDGDTNSLTNTKYDNVKQISKGLNEIRMIDEGLVKQEIADGNSKVEANPYKYMLENMTFTAQYINQQRLAANKEEFVIDPTDKREEHDSRKIVFFSQKEVDDIAEEEKFMTAFKKGLYGQPSKPAERKSEAEQKADQAYLWKSSTSGALSAITPGQPVKISRANLNIIAKDKARDFNALNVNANQFIDRAPATDETGAVIGEDARTNKEKLMTRYYQSSSSIANTATETMIEIFKEPPTDPNNLTSTKLADYAKVYDHLSPIMRQKFDSTWREEASRNYRGQHNMLTNEVTGDFSAIKEEINKPFATDTAGSVLPLKEQPFYGVMFGHNLLNTTEQAAVNGDILARANDYATATAPANSSPIEFNSVDEAMTGLKVEPIDPNNTKSVLEALNLPSDKRRLWFKGVAAGYSSWA